MARTAFYILTLAVGYLCLLAAGVWISRLLKQDLMDDVFNNENESFMQETRLIENEYSVICRHGSIMARSGTTAGSMS